MRAIAGTESRRVGASANYNASRIDCIRIERRVIILGYPLIQRLPAYRCSVGWLIRTKRPLLRLGKQREAIASRCSAIRLEETRGWWIFFSSFSLWASYRSEMWTREIDAAEDRSVVIRLAAWFARQTEIRTRRRESDFRWKDLTIPRNRTVLQFWNDFAIKMTIRINKPKKSQAQRWTDNIVWNFYW